MNAGPDVERRISTWLAEEVPTRAPDRILPAAFVTTRHTRQRRWFAAWRTIEMNRTWQLATAAVVGILLIVGGFLYFGGGQGSGVGGSPPTASPTPTAPAEASPAVTPRTERANTSDTTGWVPFVSDRYGYEGTRPPNSEFHLASTDWSLDLAATDKEAAQDWFTVGSPGDVVAISGIAADVPAGMTQDEWIAAAAFIDPDAPCKAAETWETIMVDGHEARFNRQPAAADGNGCEATTAYVFIGDRVYVFAELYGLYPELLKGYLATVRLTDAATSQAATPSP